MPLKNGRTTASLQTVLVGSVIPAGTIAPFGGGTVPAGWLLCDGSTVSRTTFANLFLAVGTLHGQGDGSTTFHLPDYRGRFLRGADNMGTGAAGRDPDAAGRTAANTGGATGAGIGSVQGGANASHTHPQNTGFNTSQVRPQIGVSGQGPSTSGFWITSGAQATTSNRVLTDATGDSTETRPQNANLIYCVKV
jgi:microcystin-dependent protein